MKYKHKIICLIYIFIMGLIIFTCDTNKLITDLNYVRCGEATGIPKPVPQLTTIAYSILIIGVPLVLIVFGILTLVKALASSNVDEVVKARKKLGKKFVIAAAALLTASLVQFVINRVTNDGDGTSVAECISCFLYSTNCGESTTGNDVKTDTIYSNYSNGAIQTTQKNSNSNSSSNGTLETYYVNSKNKIKYNLYSQADSRWGETKYSDDTTIEGIGCMITSVAVISSAADPNVNVLTVFNSNYRHDYPRNGINALSTGEFTCTAGSTSTTEITKALNEGQVVVIRVFGTKKGGSSKFTSGQHYMALIDINSDSIYVGNAYNGGTYSKTGWFKTNEVLTSVQDADYCVPSQNLLDKYK